MVDPAAGRMMQIGQVASAAGLSLRTVRHYEEVGLVSPSGRTSGGFRLYTDADLSRLLLVKRLKPLDFTLEEMREMLQLRDVLDPSEAAADDELWKAREQLAHYVERAVDRCALLRARIEATESFLVDLRRLVGPVESSRRRS